MFRKIVRQYLVVDVSIMLLINVSAVTVDLPAMKPGCPQNMSLRRQGTQVIIRRSNIFSSIGSKVIGL